MAFSYAVTKRIRLDRTKSIAWGTFTNAATDSGGDVVTGFKTVDFIVFSTNSHVGSTLMKHTISGGTVTIVCPDGVDGTWLALGSG